MIIPGILQKNHQMTVLQERSLQERTLIMLQALKATGTARIAENWIMFSSLTGPDGRYPTLMGRPMI